MLGPNIDGITEGFADKYNAVFFKSSYSLVDCDVIDKSKQLGRELSKAKYENRKIELLCELLYELKNEQNIFEKNFKNMVNGLENISALNDLNIEYVCSFVEDDFEG